MKNRRKILLFIVFIIGVVGGILFFTNQKRELTIDEILKTDAYNYLSDNVKEFIKKHYEETGELYLTEKNFKDNEAYLNPSYIEYLDSNNKDSYNIIPSVTAYVPKLMAVNDNLPSSFDLRNVDGKNYVTPNKNQGTEGLCWAYATAALLETHDLITKNKSYDSNAILFSEKQMDYALSDNGIIGGNKMELNNKTNRNISDGNSLINLENAFVKGIIGVQDIWEKNYQSKVSLNEPLESYEVFDKNNVLYEAEETVYLSNINSENLNAELKENVKNQIKNYIYNYGGAIVSINAGNSIIKNGLNNDYLNINDSRYYKNSDYPHAVQLIGWDDDYEYEFCSNGNNISTYHYDNNEKKCVISSANIISGRGAWILKNSWGDMQSFIYLTYDSFIEALLAITKYSNNDWDNNYNIVRKIRVDEEYNSYEYSFNNTYVNNEQIVKMKIKTFTNNNVKIFFSADGDSQNIVKIGEINSDYAGYKTIYFNDRNLLINNSSLIQFSTQGGIEVELFTNNVSDEFTAHTDNILLNLEDDYPTSDDFLRLNINTSLKNVNEKENIDYRIKKDGVYLPNDSYYLSHNKTYYNKTTPTIDLNASYAKKGTYTLETWNNNILLCSSSINLEYDFMPINGDGSQDNPWQIENIRHFNMIRNAPKDNYILMNDIDFKYDTTNENGLFYNFGSGWQAINIFEGNFNGNGMKLKNITTKSGIFNNFYSSKCNFDECGIHNLIIDGIINSSPSGGIINILQITDENKFNFNNLAVNNAIFSTNKFDVLDELANYRQASVGGIVGSINVYDFNSDYINTVLDINNWYIDLNFNGYGYLSDAYKINFGGLVGNITLNSNQSYIYINNTKMNSNINIEYDEKNNIIVSDLIGSISNFKGNLNINNTISNVKYKFSNGVYDNAFIGQLVNNLGSIQINNVKSTLNYSPNYLINISNYEANLKPYELARDDYSNFSNFEDKFSHDNNSIPTLKQFPEEYAEYAKNYSLKVGETKSITDLIIKDSNHKILNVYSQFECDFDVCNNVTDDTVISIPTEQNEYQFTGLKIGNTKLIIYDEVSGYLDTVAINVVEEKLKDILEDNGYNVNNSYVSKFTLGDTISTIRSKLGNDVIIETDKEIIATGAMIKKENENYTVVIKGDLTGDGKVNSGDLLQMRKYLLEEVNLAGAYKEAGIIESAGNIKSLDLLRLRQYLLGEYSFS